MLVCFHVNIGSLGIVCPVDGRYSSRCSLIPPKTSWLYSNKASCFEELRANSCIYPIAQISSFAFLNMTTAFENVFWISLKERGNDLSPWGKKKKMRRQVTSPLVALLGLGHGLEPGKCQKESMKPCKSQGRGWQWGLGQRTHILLRSLS